MKVGGGKSNSFQYFLRFGLHRIAIEVLEFLLELGQLINEIIGVVSFKFLQYLFYFPLGIYGIFKGCHRDGNDRIFALKGQQILIEEPNGAILRFADTTFIYFHFTVDEF